MKPTLTEKGVKDNEAFTPFFAYLQAVGDHKELAADADQPSQQPKPKPTDET